MIQYKYSNYFQRKAPSSIKDQFNQIIHVLIHCSNWWNKKYIEGIFSLVVFIKADYFSVQSCSKFISSLGKSSRQNNLTTRSNKKLFNGFWSYHLISSYISRWRIVGIDFFPWARWVLSVRRWRWRRSKTYEVLVLFFQTNSPLSFKVNKALFLLLARIKFDYNKRVIHKQLFFRWSQELCCSR